MTDIRKTILRHTSTADMAELELNAESLTLERFEYTDWGVDFEVDTTKITLDSVDGCDPEDVYTIRKDELNDLVAELENDKPDIGAIVNNALRKHLLGTVTMRAENNDLHVVNKDELIRNTVGAVLDALDTPYDESLDAAIND